MMEIIDYKHYIIPERTCPMKKMIRSFATQHCILFSILVCISTLLISSLFSFDNNPVTGWDKLLGDLLITIICLILIRILDLQSTSGIQRIGIIKGLKLGIPFLIIGLLGAVISNLNTNFTELTIRPLRFILLFTINMLFVGINEEILMRGLILNHFVHRGVYGNKKSIIITAVIFGAIHLPNMFFFDPTTVIVQSVNAASAGVLFAVIFLISQNLWSVILTHMLVDWISLFIGYCFVGGASIISVNMSISQGIIMILLGSLPPLIIASLYFKKWQGSKKSSLV